VHINENIELHAGEFHQHLIQRGRVAQTVLIEPATSCSGQPEEVAQAIVWLLSEKASYVTGSFIELAGGK
jgi:NAD(P)-dependent dehydrogenase (short-subunit alcohol dehydrogenase family)